MSEPVDLSERSIQNLTSGIVAGLGGARNFGGTNTNTAASGGAGATVMQGVTQLFSGANNLVSSVGLLTQGTYGLTQATGDIGKVVGMFGPVGAGLAKFGEGVVGIAVDTNKYMMDASKSGFGFSQNLGLFASSVLGAQMSLPNFKRLIDESGKSLAGLSGTASNSALAYLNMLQEINENPDIYKARLTGLDDFDQTLKISANMSRNLNMQDVASKKSVIDSAVQMGIEMDNIARLTGKSRQEQQKQMEQQNEKAEMEVFLMAATQEQQNAIKDNATALGGYSQEVRDYLTELTIGEGDTLTKKGGTTAAALEGIAPGIQSIFVELSKTVGDDPATKERRKALQAEIDAKFAAAVADKDNIKLIAKLRASEGDATTKTMGDILAGSKNTLLVQQRMLAERKEGESLADVKTRVIAMIEKERATAGTNAAAPEARPSQTMNEADIFFKQVSSGWGSALNGLNTETGTFINKLDGLNKVFGARTQAEVAMLPAELKKQMQEAIGYTGQSVNRENVSARNRNRVVEGKALGDNFVPAGWEGWVGEDGPEFVKLGGQADIKSNTVSMGMLENVANRLPVMVTGLQNDLKKQMAEAKSSMPSMEGFQQIVNTLSAKMNTAPVSTAPTASSFSPRSTDAESALQKGIDQLNSNVKQLIQAVEDSASKNIKAVKSTGNMLT